jgi:hypothetical protein
MPRTSTTTSSALQVALSAKSNASIADYFTGQEVVFPPSPIVGSFVSVLDVANLYFQTGGGDLVTLALPAPLASIFMADRVTVDPTTIPAIISAAIGSLVNQSGDPVVTFVNGIRLVRGS